MDHIKKKSDKTFVKVGGNGWGGALDNNVMYAAMSERTSALNLVGIKHSINHCSSDLELRLEGDLMLCNLILNIGKFSMNRMFHLGHVSLERLF